MIFHYFIFYCPTLEWGFCSVLVLAGWLGFAISNTVLVFLRAAEGRAVPVQVIQ